MGNGLLAWWRRRIVARGLAGAALFSVPVVVAALIGFGTSISGVAGGLSAVTSGPDAVPASAQTATPSKLNHAVVALASKQQGSSLGSPSSTGDGSGGGGGGSTLGSDGTTGSSGGGSTGSGGGTSGTQIPTISTPSAPTVPDVQLPGGGSTSGTTDAVNGTVDNVVGGVNDTLNGLLGR